MHAGSEVCGRIVESTVYGECRAVMSGRVADAAKAHADYLERSIPEKR